MGETTKISWCDATFNPWIGCTKVSAGCSHCYAESQNKHYQWVENGWGPNGHRKLTSTANWAKPITWAKQAVRERKTRRVFCASLADVFDSAVNQKWREDLWALIRNTSQDAYQWNVMPIEWLILTKRPENIETMFPDYWLIDPPKYIRIGVTVEDQNNVKRIFELHEYWKGKNFVSYEPALGPIRLPFRVDWLICGGESGAGCRSLDLSWARGIRDWCSAANTPFFMKQLGGHPNKCDDPAEWPEDLRIQEFPR